MISRNYSGQMTLRRKERKKEGRIFATNIGNCVNSNFFLIRRNNEIHIQGYNI